LFFQSAFSKSGKSKSWILMFAKFNAEKKNTDGCHGIEKKEKKIENIVFSEKRGLSLLFEMNWFVNNLLCI
jgi:hypothetical protein